MSEISELAEKLKLEGEKIYGIFSALTDDQWSAEVYTEGTTWTIRHMLSHLVTSERGLIKLFEQIRLGGEGASTDFSIDRYNAAQQAGAERRLCERVHRRRLLHRLSIDAENPLSLPWDESMRINLRDA